MATLHLGIDFGLSNLDLVLLEDQQPAGRWSQPSPGPASLATLELALELTGLQPSQLASLAVTGGRHQLLPNHYQGLALRKVGEIEAVARGGLAAAGLEQALVISVGSGTSVVAAGPSQARHLTGTALGGGSLRGLGKLLLGTSHPLEIDALARQGDRYQVDLSLAAALGGDLGAMAARGTAVNFGRIAEQSTPPQPADLAAALVGLIAQEVAIISVGAWRHSGLDHQVVVGRMIELPSFAGMLDFAWQYFGIDPRPIVPPHPGSAVALGAALGGLAGW
jgi:type II pantothenate kinase